MNERSKPLSDDLSDAQTMEETKMERLRLSRRRILQIGAVAVAGVVLDPMSVFARAGARYESIGPFSPWSEPVNLGPIVNSAFNDYHPAISRDGKSLYISSNRPGGFGDNDIWVSQRASLDDPWGAPQNLGPNINTATGSEFAPDISPDGHWLFFSRQTPPTAKAVNIMVSFRQHTHDDLGWEPAVKLGGEINQPDLDQNAPTFFRDEVTDTTTIYFNSLLRRDGPGDYDIYASTRRDDGSFGPGVLVSELCSPKRDTRTSIRRDGLEMFITSNRSGGLGQIDLWVSTRPTTLDPWSTPVNLGGTVNSSADDGGPAISADGTTLYFYSTRPGGFGGRDLYLTRRTRLDSGQESG